MIKLGNLKLDKVEYKDNSTAISQVNPEEEEEKKEKDEEEEEVVKSKEKETKNESEEKEDSYTEEEVAKLKSEGERISAIEEKDRTEEEKTVLGAFQQYEKQSAVDPIAENLRSLINDNSLDIPEDVDLDKIDNESFKDILSHNRQKAVDEYKEGLDPNLKLILNFASGGDNTLDDFLSAIYEQDYSKVSLENEDNQKEMIVLSLTEEGQSRKDALAEVELYEEKGILKTKAETAQKKLVKERQSRIDEIVSEQESLVKVKEDKLKSDADSFLDGINKLENIGGIPVDKKELLKLKSYTTKVVKNNKTQWQLDSESVENRMKSAYLMMKGFNLDSMTSKERSKVISNVKSLLSKSSDPKTRNLGSGANPEERGEGSSTDKKGLVIPKMPWMSDAKATAE